MFMRGQGRGSCTRTLAGTSTGTCDNPTERKAAHTSTRLNRRRGSQPVLSFLTQKNMPLNSSQLSMPSQSSSTSHIKSSTSPIVTLGNFRRFMVAKIFSLVIFPTSFLTSTEKTRCKFSNSSRAAISSPTDLSSCPPRGITRVQLGAMVRSLSRSTAVHCALKVLTNIPCMHKTFVCEMNQRAVLQYFTGTRQFRRSSDASRLAS